MRVKSPARPADTAMPAMTPVESEGLTILPVGVGPGLFVTSVCFTPATRRTGGSVGSPSRVGRRRSGVKLEVGTLPVEYTLRLR